MKSFFQLFFSFIIDTTLYYLKLFFYVLLYFALFYFTAYVFAFLKLHFYLNEDDLIGIISVVSLLPFFGALNLIQSFFKGLQSEK